MNKIIGKNVPAILYEDVLTGIARIINSLSVDMLNYDDELFDEVLALFTSEIENTVISYIAHQAISAKHVRTEILQSQSPD